MLEVSVWEVLNLRGKVQYCSSETLVKRMAHRWPWNLIPCEIRLQKRPNLRVALLLFGIVLLELRWNMTYGYWHYLSFVLEEHHRDDPPPGVRCVEIADGKMCKGLMKRAPLESLCSSPYSPLYPFSRAHKNFKPFKFTCAASRRPLSDAEYLASQTPEAPP